MMSPSPLRMRPRLFGGSSLPAAFCGGGGGYFSLLCCTSRSAHLVRHHCWEKVVRKPRIPFGMSCWVVCALVVVVYNGVDQADGRDRFVDDDATQVSLVIRLTPAQIRRLNRRACELEEQR